MVLFALWRGLGEARGMGIGFVGDGKRTTYVGPGRVMEGSRIRWSVDWAWKCVNTAGEGQEWVLGFWLPSMSVRLVLTSPELRCPRRGLSVGEGEQLGASEWGCL